MSLIGRLLDHSVVFDFDRTGFRRHARTFDPADLALDLGGRRALVTGANAGLGRAAAEALLALGAEVHLLCRSAERGAAAREALARAGGGDRVHLTVVDLGDPASVDACVARFAGQRVDVLVHNAGLLNDARVVTADGWPQETAVHLLGPYRLTAGLRGALAGGRVIFVSSGGALTQRLDVDALQRTTGPYDGVVAYAQTKRAQIVLAAELDAAWPEVAVHAMHPGWADTGGVARSLPRFHALTRPLLRTPAQGADTIVWLAACPRLAGARGDFWFDRRPADAYRLARTREAPAERARLMASLDEWLG